MAKFFTIPRLFETKEGLLDKNNVLYSRNEVHFLYDRPVTEEDVRNGLTHCLKKAERAKKIDSAVAVANNATIVKEGPWAIYRITSDDIAWVIARYPPDKGSIGPKPAPPPIITFLGLRSFKKIKVLTQLAIYGTNKLGH